MNDYRGDRPASFVQRFLRSPVRWVVLAHVLLLGIVIGMRSAIPGAVVLYTVDASLVVAQVALLIIWMTLVEREGMIRRTLGSAFVVVGVFALHMPPSVLLVAIRGVIFNVAGVFILLAILAFPLSFASTRGLQLMRFSPESMPPPQRLQFSIRTILLAAICLALLFGLRGLLDLAKTWPVAIRWDLVLITVVMFVVGATFYLSIPLVAVWATLTPGKVLPRMATALFGWALGAMLLYHYIQSGAGSSPMYVSVTIVTACAIPILLATLLVLRAMGYRFIRSASGNPFRKEPGPGTQLEPASPFDDVTHSSHHPPR